MFSIIYTFELKRLLQQPATYVYFVVFFSIGLLSMLGTGGFFDGVQESHEEIRLLNSAYEINSIFHFFNKFFLFMLPFLTGRVIFKDFKNNVHPIVYTFPIHKSGYLMGKFFSSLTVVFLIAFSVGMAFYLGELLLGPDNAMIGASNLGGYASAYFVFVLPNMFMFSLLVFVAVASTRNIYAGFVTVLLLLLFQIMMENLFAGNPMLVALLDPFGQNSFSFETRFWTLAEQNVRQTPVLGIVLWNRVLWTTICLFLIGFFYKKFQLEQETFHLFPDVSRKKTAEKKHVVNQPSNHPKINSKVDFSFRQQLLAMLKLSAIDFRFIIKNRLFHVLLLFGILALVFALGRVTNSADMTFLPLTRIMLYVPLLFFSIVIMVITFIYSGMLVHRSRIAKINQLIDTTATANWVLMGSQILSLLQVQFVLLVVLMVCGIGLQVYNGYYHFEMGLYLFQLFIITFPTLIIWAVLSVFIHTVLPNVYLGIFLLLLFWLGIDQLPQFGIESFLLRFNSSPELIYSDMNGYGNGLPAKMLVMGYWLVFAGLILILTYLFWERGFLYSIKERIKIAVHRFKGPVPYALMLLILLLTILGFKTYEEENSPFKAVGNDEKLLEKVRTDFGEYKAAVQPKITAVKLNIEIFPDSQSFFTKGEYLLVNKSLQEIDTLLIKTGYDEITSYTLGAPSHLVIKDERMNFAVQVLENPLMPNDSLRMTFEIKNKPNTLFYQNSTILQNGTLLKTDILPRFGYFFEKELRNPSDSQAKHFNFYAQDADLVDVETVISTHRSQTAIAPGSLQDQWTENERNYFHYKTEEKIKFVFAFNSGVFSLYNTLHKGVNLKVYHHESHTFNLKDMIDGLKASLDYNTYFFGPYQHNEARIIEFPLTEGSYASVMSNSIPTSEVRFILKNKDSDNKVNLSFYVQAHELTHQWWGNQVAPADALGAKMLTESITEYISLRIYERCFGPKKAQHFLSLQRKRYLHGRTKETGQENPLYLVHPDQEYIAYGKGSMALNTLQYYVGEDKLNGILKTFLEAYKFRTDRYPTSIDLIKHLKKGVSPEFHYIISDMMESVTLYDHKIKSVKQLPADKLEVVIHVKKMDHTLNTELKAREIFLDIGQYDKEGCLLRIHNFKVSSGKNTITIPRETNVKSIIIDPLLHFVELDIENNSININND